MAGSLSLAQIGAFLFAVLTQIIGVSFLIRTKSFTDAGWTVLTVVVLVSSFWSLAWLLGNGAKLNILLPLLAATVPLASMMIGIFIYGEPASFMKVGMLVAACALVGGASAIS